MAFWLRLHAAMKGSVRGLPQDDGRSALDLSCIYSVLKIKHSSAECFLACTVLHKKFIKNGLLNSVSKN